MGCSLLVILLVKCCTFSKSWDWIPPCPLAMGWMLLTLCLGFRWSYAAPGQFNQMLEELKIFILLRCELISLFFPILKMSFVVLIAIFVGPFSKISLTFAIPYSTPKKMLFWMLWRFQASILRLGLQHPWNLLKKTSIFVPSSEFFYEELNWVFAYRLMKMMTFENISFTRHHISILIL